MPTYQSVLWRQISVTASIQGDVVHLVPDAEPCISDEGANQERQKGKLRHSERPSVSSLRVHQREGLEEAVQDSIYVRTESESRR